MCDSTHHFAQQPHFCAAEHHKKRSTHLRASFLLLPQWQHIFILVDLFHHPIRKVPASAVQRLAAVGAQDIRAVRQSEKMPLFAVGKGDDLHLLPVQHMIPDELVVLLVFLVGVVAVLWGIIRTLWKPAFDKGIWFAGAGTVLTVLALLLVAGYNNTAYYPSTHDLQSSLTLANSCSSQFTLKVMAYVSILVPFVLAYIFYAWRSIDNRKIDAKEMEEGGHAY